MSFTSSRIVRFQDTDAAGVVYFTNVLAMCHEAYEESLAASSINLKSFFTNSTVAIPIVHASVDFFRPMFCGDKILIHLTPQYLDSDYFELAYKIVISNEQQAAKAITEHVCINPASRKRQELPIEVKQWFEQWKD